MISDKIGDWSEAELRRFIANTVLSDPANQKDDELPPGGAPGQLLTQLVTGQLAWGGGAVKIAEVFGTGTGTVVFDPIPQTFRHLLLVHSLRSDTAATGVNINARFNGDSGGNYFWQHLTASGGGVSAAAVTFAGSGFFGDCPAATEPSRKGAGFQFIPDYARADKESQPWVGGTFDWEATGNIRFTGGMWLVSAALKTLTLLPNAGNWTTDSVATLYGLG